MTVTTPPLKPVSRIPLAAVLVAAFYSSHYFNIPLNQTRPLLYESTLKTDPSIMNQSTHKKPNLIRSIGLVESKISEFFQKNA